MHTGRLTLLAEKVAEKRLRPEVIQRQLKTMIRKGLGKTLVERGWRCVGRPKVQVMGAPGAYRYQVCVHLRRQGQKAFGREAFQTQCQHISRRFYSGGRALSWLPPDSHPATRICVRQPEQSSGDKPAPMVCPSQSVRALAAQAIVIPDNWEEYYSHLYGQDYNIRQIIGSIRTAKETNMGVREHVLCFGFPGTGKTETLLATAKMLGPNAVKRLDATDTTKAGAVNLLLELETIPPILVLEELEKCHEDNMSWLLGVMDERGEISKTNQRISSVQREAPCLVLATVNDMDRFLAFHDGALADRFAEPLYFGMPSRELLEKILLREVARIPGGKTAWVKPALDFAIDVEKTCKPRRIRAIMTNGRDALLDGSYQQQRELMLRRRLDDMDRLNASIRDTKRS